MPNKNLFVALVVLVVSISCSQNPNGMYEGEIKDNKVLLDFTVANVVIVKYSNIYYYNKESIYLNKERCSWIKKENTFFVWDDNKNLKYILNFNGKDLVDKLSGERLVKKQSD